MTYFHRELYQLTHVRVTRGVNVLDNKSELRKEIDKRKQRQQRRDDYQRQRQNRSSFELRLEQQASKLDLVTADYMTLHYIILKIS